MVRVLGWLRRQSLAVLLIFGGASIGLPLADAVLFHGPGTTQTDGANQLSTGNLPRGHSQLCFLQHPAPVETALATPAQVRAPIQPRPRLSAESTPVAESTPPRLLPLSRGPPVSA